MGKNEYFNIVYVSLFMYGFLSGRKSVCFCFFNNHETVSANQKRMIFV